jgi:formylmethanofuran dehydrogenase subunit E
MSTHELFNEPSFQKCIEFHGHISPGVSIGFRAAKAGLDLIEENFSFDEELVATVETDNCAVDAIQVLTGCTFGKGNFFYRDIGKNAFTFQSRKSGKGFRIVMKNNAFNMNPRHAELAEKKKQKTATEEELNEYQKLHLERSHNILKMKLDDLFEINKTERPIPPMAVMMPSEICTTCGEGVMPTKMIINDGKKYCIDYSG